MSTVPFNPLLKETTLKPWYFVVAMSVALYACQASTQPPAPLGERAALEKLANTYESLSQQLPASPAGLTPQGKLKFVQDVFKKAGYSYTGTLRALALTAPENLNANHKDMMELLFMPHHGLSRQDWKTLYSNEEIASIEKIDALLAQTATGP